VRSLSATFVSDLGDNVEIHLVSDGPLLGGRGAVTLTLEVSMFRRAFAAAAAVLVVVSVSACASTSAGEREATASPTPRVEVQRFGASHLYADGSRIATTPLEEYTPHKWAGNVSEDGAGVLTTITITNGTPKPMYPFVYPVARSGGASTEPVGGSVDGLGITAASPIPAGRSISFPMGFSVSDMGEVTIPLSPNPGYDPVVFSTIPRGTPIPDAPRYTERGVPVDDDTLCAAWQSQTVIPLEVAFENGAVDPRTGAFIEPRPDLASFTDEDVARFKLNAMSTAPREGCEPRWTDLDFRVRTARDSASYDAENPPSSGESSGYSSSGGGSDVDLHVYVDLPDVVDCWKLWRPRCW